MDARAEGSAGMSDLRMVAMTAEQAAEIDRYIELLMRGHMSERASTMMNLALAYKFARPQEPELPTNVYPIVRHAGDSWSKRVS